MCASLAGRLLPGSRLGLIGTSTYYRRRSIRANLFPGDDMDRQEPVFLTNLLIQIHIWFRFRWGRTEFASGSDPSRRTWFSGGWDHAPLTLLSINLFSTLKIAIIFWSTSMHPVMVQRTVIKALVIMASVIVLDAVYIAVSHCQCMVLLSERKPESKAWDHTVGEIYVTAIHLFSYLKHDSRCFCY